MWLTLESNLEPSAHHADTLPNLASQANTGVLHIWKFIIIGQIDLLIMFIDL